MRLTVGIISLPLLLAVALWTRADAPATPDGAKAVPPPQVSTPTAVAPQKQVATKLPTTGPTHAAGPSFVTDVRPILAEYCYSCHGPMKKKGELDLAALAQSEKPETATEVWNDVSSHLSDHTMPPKKNPHQPSDPQRQIVMTWVTQALGVNLAKCGSIATDANTRYYQGHVTGRRLTRFEYQNTIQSLTNVDVPVMDLLPDDGSGGEGFDTAGDALFISTISIEKYLQAAEQVVRATVLDPGPAGAKARARLFVATPRVGLSAHDAARQNLEAFTYRAFRRPTSSEEVDKYVRLFDKASARGENFAQAMSLAIRGVLISPHFLFMVEVPPAEPGVFALGDYELASRLSYFLWSSMPDDELMQVAHQKRLHDASVLRAQTRRMLLDPRAHALAWNFGREWLTITGFGVTQRPDPRRFPDFDESLVKSMRDEAVLLVDHIFRDDRPLTELINANYSFLNERLATHYGIPNVHGSEMRLVQLADRNRGGILSLGAVMISTSYPLRTSPVLRGKWILEQVLGERVPPPPPTAGTLPPDDHQSDGLTLRQRLEKHRSQAECASCHARLDPMGFGLENFDPTGRWRVLENGAPIDASGQLAGANGKPGEIFAGPAALRDVVAARHDQFVRTFCRKMLGYALGRVLGPLDQCVLDDCVKQLASNGGRSSGLFEQIVLSAPFQYRYATK